MRMIAVMAMLAMTACSSKAVKKDLTALEQRIDKLEIEHGTKLQRAFLFYQELLSRHDVLEKKAGRIDATLKALEISMERLHDDLKTTKTRVALSSGGGNRETTDVDPPAAPVRRDRRKLEEIMMDIEKTLSQLRSSKLTAKEARILFKPDGLHAAPRLIEELRTYITNLDYTRKLETILAGLSPDDLRFPLSVALTKSGSRESAALIVGRTGNRTLSKILEAHVKTVDEDFRVLLGEALTLCRNAAGIPLLVKCLTSTDSDTRRIALHALRNANKGKDFGYRPGLTPEENREALIQWQEWKDKFGPGLWD